MSASAWDRAVEASVAALNREEWSANLPGYCLSETILAAALPVLLEELAQLIEAEERLPYAMQRYVRHADVRIVRGFAAEASH